ncbi:hypothetical protein B7486_68545 [cyanobacterium TDX16]|nr:hypothetical protein B7486_68545 [cyanobacterium TDX16]
MVVSVMEATSLRFAGAVRSLGRGARQHGLVLPGFRSPPRVDADRTLRWRSDGSAVVAVRLRDRPWSAVLGDMVEGVIVANGLEGRRAERCRTALWAAVEQREHGTASAA